MAAVSMSAGLEPEGRIAGARVAIVHDYLTQRGGAERVVLAMLKAFPGAAVYTSLYRPETTYDEFRDADVRTLAINRLALLRRHHRLAFPLLAPAFSRLEIDADVVLCDSSGWAHGVRARGRKVVFCHTPARWLYKAPSYFRTGPDLGRAAVALLGPSLRRWDQRAACTAHRYLANSSEVRSRVLATYGRDAEVLLCPPGLDPTGPQEAVPGVGSGYFLAVSRLVRYKNLAAVVRAFRDLPDQRLVVVGTGPEEGALRRLAGPNVTMCGPLCRDAQLRWLYGNSAGVVAAAYEDQGLIPLEAAGFGKPTAALQWGGYLETVVDRETGLFFDRPEPGPIATSVRELCRTTWSSSAITKHADRFSEARFIRRLQQIVAEELGC